MESLGEALPKEQSRVREVLGYYRELGEAGVFAEKQIKRSLEKADSAIIGGDIIEMMTAYKELQEIK